MSTDSLHKGHRLKELLSTLPHGTPVTTRQLEAMGISRQLAHRYVQSGWLEPLGYGYFLRIGDSVTRTGAAAALQSQGIPVHIGGRTALALRGHVHSLPLGEERLFLFGAPRRSLPTWLLKIFPVEARAGRLFREGKDPAERLSVSGLEYGVPDSPLTAEPERALLELLDEVPGKQGLEEAARIMEPLFTLRPDRLQGLLEACTRVKVKRLFYALAERFQLPVLDHLDPARIDFGAPSGYSLSRRGESLVLKHPVPGNDG